MSLAGRALSPARRSVHRYRMRRDPFARFLTTAPWPDPYPMYEKMRARGPIYRSPRFDVHVVTDYELAVAILKDDRFSVVDSASGSRLVRSDALLRLDPPRQTQLRHVVNSGFTIRAVDKMAGWLTDTTHAQIDVLVDRTEIDVVEDFALPLPVAVIAQLLGIHGDDAGQLRVLSRGSALGLDPGMTGKQRQVANKAADATSAYFSEIIEQRRFAAGDNVLSLMVAARDSGSMTDAELLANVLLILVAGYATVTSMISSGMNILLDRPALWKTLREQPDFIPNFVEEVLRCEAPVQMTARIATVDVDLDEHVSGYAVPKGDALTIIFGGANRDSAVFDDPSQFDPQRDNANKHLAFAAGAHYCLGAALARLEGKSAFTALTQRLPAIRRAGPIRRLPATVSRSTVGLPIAVNPGVLARQS